MPQESPLNDFHTCTKRAGLDLTEGAGGANTVGSSLDHLIGTWTQAEADEIDAALEHFETVDGIAWTQITTVSQPNG